MTKKIIVVAAVILVTAVMVYIGIINDLTYKAEADEAVIYPVLVVKNIEYGYIPKHDFGMSKPTLEAYVKLCWWEAQWLDSGDLMIGFEVDDKETWFVKLIGNDPEIKKIQNIVNDYGLKCAIPD